MAQNFDGPSMMTGQCVSARIPNPGNPAKIPTVLSELEVLTNSLDHIYKLTLELEERLTICSLRHPRRVGWLARWMPTPV
jgi:hypothetical protein